VSEFSFTERPHYPGKTDAPHPVPAERLGFNLTACKDRLKPLASEALIQTPAGPADSLGGEQ
jgi:hypothetical protein